jgi:hypothetical protein
MGGMTHYRSFRRSIGSSLGAVAVLAAVALAGLQSTAVAAGVASPQIAGQASSSGLPVGIALFDTATLGLGNSPTGVITFRLYSPLDPACVGNPLFTWNTTVNGNGYYQSGSWVSVSAGSYHWVASYSGDANNNPASTACADDTATVSVAKRASTLSGIASVLSSGATNDTATVLGANPTGTLSFSLYGPDDPTCADAPVFTSTKSIYGMGSWASDPIVPSLPGTYQWTVLYSGDANNWASGTNCADSSNTVQVGGAAAASISVTASPATVKAGTPVTVSWSNIPKPTSGDWVALYAAGAPDSVVKTWRYTGGTATGSINLTVPWGSAPGSYEVRLFSNNSYSRLGTASVTVVS